MTKKPTLFKLLLLKNGLISYLHKLISFSSIDFSIYLSIKLTMYLLKLTTFINYLVSVN